MSPKNNETLAKFTEKLFLDIESADVFFIIDDGFDTVERIPGHKYLLAAISDVFYAMFYGELKELGDITVYDVDPDIFKVFLKFAYYEHVDLTIKNVVQLMHLGEYYNVVNCFHASVNFLKKNVTSEVVCTVLKHALLYNENELETICANQIAVNTKKVFLSNDFLNCDREVLRYILYMDVISCSEMEVFEACMAWVKAKGKQGAVIKQLIREHLGDLFYEIRFVTMSTNDLITICNSHRYAFSHEELNDIVRSLEPSPQYPKLFNANPRQVKWKSNGAVRCKIVVRDSKKILYKINRRMCITFSTNKLLLFRSFTCNPVFYISEPVSPDLPVNVTVFESESLLFCFNEQNVAQFEATLSSRSRQVISLPVPLLMRPGRVYKIFVDVRPGIESAEFCFFSKNVQETVQIDHDIHLKFHLMQNAWDSDQSLSICTELQFDKLEAGAGTTEEKLIPKFDEIWFRLMMMMENRIAIGIGRIISKVKNRLL